MSHIVPGDFKPTMKRSLLKNLIVFFIAIAIAGAAWYFVYQRDKRITGWFDNHPYAMDSTAMYFTDHEVRVAKKFSDTTLPGLQRRGLITKYDRQDMETVIAVSGRVWKKRSTFFKESFLTQIMIHNRVRSFATAVRIIDHRTGRLYAQVNSSGVKKIYE